MVILKESMSLVLYFSSSKPEKLGNEQWQLVRTSFMYNLIRKNTF